MDYDKDSLILFKIAEVIKRSYENPVILLTQQDYTDTLLKTVIELQNAVQQNTSQESITKIINKFHMEWLKIVHDVEKFKKRGRDTPREVIFHSIDWTLENLIKRYDNFKKYTVQYLDVAMNSELNVIEDMKNVAHSAIVEKQKSLSYKADKNEFYVIISNEIEELLNWIDKMTNHLTVELCKILDLPSQLLCDLNQTLYKIILEIARGYNFSDGQRVSYETSNYGNKYFRAIADACEKTDEGITTTFRKITDLENQLRSDGQDVTAKLLLEHKHSHLKEHLETLENFRCVLLFLNNQHTVLEDDEYSNGFHMFNHLLPHNERNILVDKLARAWLKYLSKFRSEKSLISILSPGLEQTYKDEIGDYCIDKYGRKIYTLKEDFEIYQINHDNELVPVNDDDRHVYFYDERGRYYLGSNNERVYKVSENASEYFLNKAGMMVKEVDQEEVEYCYNDIGRPYVNEDGFRLYRDINSMEDYTTDGFGNYVKLRSSQMCLQASPVPSVVLEENLYLRRTVGEALKKCLTDVVLTQPPDPIENLADRLEKYQLNINKKEAEHKQTSEDIK